MRPFWLWVFFGLVSLIPLRAVENSNGYFDFDNTVDPITGQIDGWDAGWGNAPTGVTGWNYVGMINVPGGYLSGVYLGNGYVLTAAHGGTVINNYVLGGVTYTAQSGSVQTFSTFSDGTGGQADLLLFKLNAGPILPALSLASDLPMGYDDTTSTAGSDSVIVGYGFPGALESWGTGNIFQTEGLFSISGFTSIDYDIFNINSGAPASSGNMYNLYPGDSGGADFVYNASIHQWQLAGINEFVATEDDGTPFASGFVHVSDYLSQIDAMVPEPSTYALLVCGLAGLLFFRRRFYRM